MGVEPFLVATSVHMIVAQRLIRRICTYCKEPLNVGEQALIDVGFDAKEAKTLDLFKGTGCERCNSTGYKGRVGLFEVMAVNDAIRDTILSGGTATEIRQSALDNGMMTLRGSGLQKIRDGVTTLEEVTRETVL